VLSSCINHALISDGEEVMGLLLGDTVPDGNGGRVTNIWRAIPQIRNDRRKVRWTCCALAPDGQSTAGCLSP
jgi:hypothetical protein